MRVCAYPLRAALRASIDNVQRAANGVTQRCHHGMSVSIDQSLNTLNHIPVPMSNRTYTKEQTPNIVRHHIPHIVARTSNSHYMLYFAARSVLNSVEGVETVESGCSE
jgi:hypothetical protein